MIIDEPAGRYHAAATRSGDAPARGKSTEPKALPKLLRRARTPPGPGSPHRPGGPGRGLRPAGMAVSIQTGCAALDSALFNRMVAVWACQGAVRCVRRLRRVCGQELRLVQLCSSHERC